jgi:hypothetical protein
MIEILIQKDSEWLQTEAEKDLRMVFFTQFLYQNDPGYENRLKVGIKYPSLEEVVNVLREKRNDTEFTAAIGRQADGIVTTFREILSDAKGSLERSEDQRIISERNRAELRQGLEERLLEVNHKIGELDPQQTLGRKIRPEDI